MWLVVALTPAKGEQKNKLTMALDVSPFAFSGGSFKMGWVPATFSGSEFSLEWFSMEIPQLVVDLNSKNKGKGWKEKVDWAWALYYDQKWGESKNDFYYGLGFVYLKEEVKNDQLFQYSQLEYLLRFSYKYHPFESLGFYLQPYVALAYRHKILGHTGTYSLQPFLVIPSMYLSWEF